MKGDGKAISFVEDTAVAPEKLRDYIERFLADRRAARHHRRRLRPRLGRAACTCGRSSTSRPPTAWRQFEAIANEVADLVLEFGGALSGEHGDGLVRGAFNEKMFGPDALPGVPRREAHLRSRTASSTPAASSTRRRSPRTCASAPATRRPTPATFFDFSERRRASAARSRCAAASAPCRKTREGTMCPSYMATREEAHSTRGRANVLRLAMTGQLGDARLRRPGRARGARPVPRVPRLQERVPGRRGHGALQERVPRRLLGAPRRCRCSAQAFGHVHAAGRAGAAASRRSSNALAGSAPGGG